MSNWQTVRWVGFWCGLLWLSNIASLAAQELKLLYEQTPYDLITLDEENRSEVIQVFALDEKVLPGRKVPANPDPDAEIQVRLVTQPEQAYRLHWKHIVKIRLFEEELLAEAAKLVREQKFDEAFSYYRLLLSKYRTFPGVTASYELYLQRMIELSWAQNQYDQALGRVLIWHEFNPAATPIKQYGVPTLEKYLDSLVPTPTAAQLLQASTWLRQLQRRDPTATTTKLTALQQRLIQQATAILAQARQALTNNQRDQAEQFLQLAADYWPAVPGLTELRSQFEAGSARITVGLLHGFATDWSHRAGAVEWRVRRDQRLLTTGPADLQDWKAGVPSYQPQWVDASKVNTHTGFLPLNSSASEKLGPLWTSKLVTYQWPLIKLTTEQKQPGLSVPLTAKHASPLGWASLARFPNLPSKLTSTPEFASRLLVNNEWSANPKALFPLPADSMRIKTVPLTDFDSAVQQLQAGKILAVDRIAPWQANNLAKDRSLVVEPYAIPAVHLLLINPQSILLQQPIARTAVITAINRTELLEQVMRGNTHAEAKVPITIMPGLPAPASQYATWEVRPTPDRDLAKLLWQASQQPGIAKTKLRLVIPADEVAQVIGKSLVSQLNSAGIPVELVPSKDPFIPTSEQAAQADLVYWYWHPVDSAVDWPLVQTASPWQGLGSASATFTAAVINSSQASPVDAWHLWEASLLSERCVWPLLHLPEFSAYRRSLQKFGSRPVDLFQHSSQWRLQPTAK